MNHERKILVHLAHAKRKHPQFVDVLLDGFVLAHADRELRYRRDRIEARKDVSANIILDCELAEVYEAIANGRAEDAVEEIYDAVAVLLRMAEWVNEKGCK